MKFYTPGWRSNATRRMPFINGRFKDSLKRGLSFFALSLILVLVVWPYLHHKMQTLPPLETKRLFEKNPKLANKLINPEMTSVDSKGHPFTVRARHALQVDPSVTTLDQPQGNFLMEDGTPVRFKANQGRFLPEAKALHLSGNVMIATDNGYQFTTCAANIDLASGQGTGHSPLYGRGPNQEHIEAEGFKLSPNNDKILFLGKTHITLATQ